MRIKVLLILLITNFFAFSQNEQNICDENKDGNYFIFKREKEKKIFAWFDTSLFQIIKKEKKKINGKLYYQIIQVKEDNNEMTINLVREENGVIYKYEESCKTETILFDEKFKVGKVWKSANGKAEMKLISYNAILKTPICEYQNLLEIEVTMNSNKFHDYYLKGQGYIGTTLNNKDKKLVSFLIRRL